MHPGSVLPAAPHHLLSIPLQRAIAHLIDDQECRLVHLHIVKMFCLAGLDFCSTKAPMSQHSKPTAFQVHLTQTRQPRKASIPRTAISRLSIGTEQTASSLRRTPFHDPLQPPRAIQPLVYLLDPVTLTHTGGNSITPKARRMPISLDIRDNRRSSRCDMAFLVRSDTSEYPNPVSDNLDGGLPVFRTTQRVNGGRRHNEWGEQLNSGTSTAATQRGPSDAGRHFGGATTRPFDQFRIPSPAVKKFAHKFPHRRVKPSAEFTTPATAATTSGLIGSMAVPKNATGLPSRPIRYLPKFHTGSWPVALPSVA